MCVKGFLRICTLVMIVIIITARTHGCSLLHPSHFGTSQLLLQPEHGAVPYPSLTFCYCPSLSHSPVFWSLPLPYILLLSLPFTQPCFLVLTPPLHSVTVPPFHTALFSGPYPSLTFCYCPSLSHSPVFWSLPLPYILLLSLPFTQPCFLVLTPPLHSVTVRHFHTALFSGPYPSLTFCYCPSLSHSPVFWSLPLPYILLLSIPFTQPCFLVLTPPLHSVTVPHFHIALFSTPPHSCLPACRLRHTSGGQWKTGYCWCNRNMGLFLAPPHTGSDRWSWQRHGR